VVYLLATGLAIWSTLNQIHVAWFDTGLIALMEGRPSSLSPSELAHLQGSVPAGVAALGVCVTFYLLSRLARLALARSAAQSAPEQAAFWAADGPEPVEQALQPDAPELAHNGEE
jgi:hypothetical protein